VYIPAELLIVKELASSIVSKCLSVTKRWDESWKVYFLYKKWAAYELSQNYGPDLALALKFYLRLSQLRYQGKYRGCEGAI